MIALKAVRKLTSAERGQFARDEGYDVVHNGVPRTFRDKEEIANEAARFVKVQRRADLIERIAGMVLSW